MDRKRRAKLEPREFTTDAAAARLGISPSQLRRIAAARGYEPSRVEEWHRGRQSGTRHFWSARTLATIRRTRDYAQTVERAARQRQHVEHLRAEAARKEEERRQAEQTLLDEIALLSVEELVRYAVECLHAANRAAKHAGQVHMRLTIYGAKDRFLSAMVRAGRATVETFEVQQTSGFRVCTNCGREWVGDSHCYLCDDCTGVAALEVRRWYVVDVGHGYRFHQPIVPTDIAQRAIPVAPHNPTQEPRSVPLVRFGDRPLDLTAQVSIVLAAAKRLTAQGPSHDGPEIESPPSLTRRSKVHHGF